MIRLSLPGMATLLCVGCAAGDPIPAAELLNHPNCTITQAGMQVVSYEEVARLRGSTLLNMTTAQVNSGPDVVLIVISNGRQPTPGYRFDLTDAFTVGGIATLELRWLVPDEDALQPQMITYPCIVIGLERNAFNQVRALDEHGNLLGEVFL